MRRGHRPPPRQDLSSPPSGSRFVIGDHAIAEVLRVRPQEIDKAFLVDNWEDSQELRTLEKELRSRKVKIENKNSVSLDRIGSHQGAVLTVRGAPTLDLDKICEKKKCLLLALDGVEDPHNLGAILRSAWLLGVSGLLLSQERSVGLTPIVHKVASGGVEHVPCERVTQFAPSFAQLKEAGFWIFGLSHRADKTIFDLKLPEKVVWVLGSEGKGLRSTTEKVCDELVKLPQTQADASFNVSVAAGMALSESFRQLNS